jgi:hypothetical protein
VGRAYSRCPGSCFVPDSGPDSQGSLHVLTSFSDILSTSAYLLRVSLVYQMRQRNVIITVGDDEDLMPFIRVWNYEKLTKEGMPTLSRSIPALIPNGRQTSVSTKVVVVETVIVAMSTTGNGGVCPREHDVDGGGVQRRDSGDCQR